VPNNDRALKLNQVLTSASIDFELRTTIAECLDDLGIISRLGGGDVPNP
jgi:hypothetical protein